MNTEHLFVATTPGLEPAVERELSWLGLSAKAESGGVSVFGPALLHQELNLQLRTASRVLWRLATFHAADERSVRQALARVELGGVWDKRSAVRLGVSVHATRGLQARELEQWAREVWRLPAPARSTLPEDEADGSLQLLLRVEAGEFSVSVDTSGELLYRRGYRQETSHAPLRETLAAGVLVLAGYRGDCPVWDPMCGSGTLVIEAALWARNRAPGVNRSFGFMAFPSFTGSVAQAWERRLEAARAQERPSPHLLFGTDLNAGALGVARRNARRAGVGEALLLERRDALSLTVPPGVGPGLVVVNPPYGKRVGEVADLDGLYRGLGERLSTVFSGWRAAVLVPNPKLEAMLGLELEQACPVQNGGIRCQLLIGRGRKP